MALTPAVFSVGPTIETRLFPVFSGTRVIAEAPDDTGVEFQLEFWKRRQCEFLGLAWYVGAVRLPMQMEADATEPPGSLTRPMGAHRAGPWRIPGLASLRGTRAYALHRCHPLWITVTEFYRG